MLVQRLRCTALVAAGALALGGCAGSEPDVDPGTTGTATSDLAPTEASPTETAPTDPDPTDAGPTPTAAAELCAPYLEMAAAVAGVDPHAATDEVVAELAPVMRAWARDLDGTERPRAMPPEVWAGVELLVGRILSLPEKPSYAQLEAVAEGLSARDKELLTTASSWFVSTCGAG